MIRYLQLFFQHSLDPGEADLENYVIFYLIYKNHMKSTIMEYFPELHIPKQKVRSSKFDINIDMSTRMSNFRSRLAAVLYSTVLALAFCKD